MVVSHFVVDVVVIFLQCLCLIRFLWFQLFRCKMLCYIKSVFTSLVLVALLGAVRYYYVIDIKVCLAENECSKNNRAEDGSTAL